MSAKVVDVLRVEVRPIVLVRPMLENRDVLRREIAMIDGDAMVTWELGTGEAVRRAPDTMAYRTAVQTARELAVDIWVEQRLTRRILTDEAGGRTGEVFVSEGYYVRLSGVEWEPKVTVR